MTKKRVAENPGLTDAEILRERAKRLSQPISEPTNNDADNRREVLCFSLKNERYAIDIPFVTESTHLQELTPVPGMPSFLTGITHIRGKFVPVINMKDFFQLGHQGISASTNIVLLSLSQIDIAVQVDTIDGTRWIQDIEIKPAPSTVKGFGAEHIKGATADGLILLDGERLLKTLYKRLTNIQP